MTNQETKVTDKPMTLRQKIVIAMDDLKYDDDYDMFMDAICDALEDTGAPAHMRVAKELRGEVE